MKSFIRNLIFYIVVTATLLAIGGCNSTGGSVAVGVNSDPWRYDTSFRVGVSNNHHRHHRPMAADVDKGSN